MTRRRDLFLLLGAAALTPRAVFGQPKSGMPHVGYLSPLTSEGDAVRREAFRQGLRELGYQEDKTIAIQYRFADGDFERLPVLAAELVGLKVQVIVAAGGGQIALAAKRASGSIPIVMTNVEDPVASGLVASLARPGGNVTGLSALTFELSAKRVELIRDTVPKLRRLAVMWNAAYPEKQVEVRQIESGARTLGIELLSAPVKSTSDVERALNGSVLHGADALFVLPDPLTNTETSRILDHARKRRLPTMFSQRPPIDAGGLLSYGPSYAELFRRAAFYVDRILKGAKAADLPVEQPTRFELVVNLKTAKALGITIPQSVLARADRVIE